jgi:hypothetical protein
MVSIDDDRMIEKMYHEKRSVEQISEATKLSYNYIKQRIKILESIQKNSRQRWEKRDESEAIVCEHVKKESEG